MKSKQEAIDVEKDLYSKKFKKDPFSNKCQLFLCSDVYASAGSKTNSDGLGMNLQLRSEMIKAQIQSLLGEAKEASSKFLVPVKDAKKKTAVKQATSNKILDDESDEKYGNEKDDEVGALVMEKTKLLRTLSHQKTALHKIYTTQEEHLFCKLTSTIHSARSSSLLKSIFRPGTSKVDGDFASTTLSEPYKISDHRDTSKSRLSSLLQSHTYEQFCTSLNHVVHEELLSLTLPSLLSKSNAAAKDCHGDLSRYLKYILPFSFPTDGSAVPPQPDMCEPMDTPDEHFFVSNNDEAACVATDGCEYDCYAAEMAYADETTCPDSDIQPAHKHVDIGLTRTVSHFTPTNTATALVCEEEEEEEEEEGGDEETDFSGTAMRVDERHEANLVSTRSKKRKTTASSQLKHKKKKKKCLEIEKTGQISHSSSSSSSPSSCLSQQGSFLKCPTLSALRLIRQQHCNSLQTLIGRNPRARKKLEDIAAKRRRARGGGGDRHATSGEEEGSGDAMSLLLPLPPPCPPPLALGPPLCQRRPTACPTALLCWIWTRLVGGGGLEALLAAATGYYTYTICTSMKLLLT
jgi:hypothetical protein